VAGPLLGVTPQISAAGVEHLDTMFQPYINVEPGRGEARRDFEIQETTISDSAISTV
jgi:paraquat-inducible protein B